MNRPILITCILIFLFAPIATSQIEISGRITDCENDGISGVSITLKKKKHGVLSDMQGNYKISVPDSNAILKYSSIGLVEQRIKVGNQKTINVKLISDSKQQPEKEVIAYKPIIYLYPETDQIISLKFNYNGKVLITYPEYNNGWNVTAHPNGTLTNNVDKKEYSYLFWEGKRIYSNKETQYSNGFIVQRDSTVEFLQKVLPKLGLKPNEYNEFIVFWIPQLLTNEWNFIYFRTGNEYNIISENFVNPKPDSEIRIFMEYKNIEKPFKVVPQTINTPTRQGFTLIEWGGSLIDKGIFVKDENGEFMKR